MPYECMPMFRTWFTPKYVIRIVWNARMLIAAAPKVQITLSTFKWRIAM